MKIDFHSPVNNGDDVNMTCSYNSPGAERCFHLVWKRFNHATGANETVWKYYGRKDGDYEKTSNRPGEPYFQSKIEHTHQTFYDESHRIRLLDAEQNDIGRYWCYVGFTSFVYEYFISPAKELDVGESCEHARKYKYLVCSLCTHAFR